MFVSKQVRHLIIGAVIAIVVLLPVGTFAFVKSGLFNVGASSPHTKLTTWLTHETMIHSVRARANVALPPSRVTSAEIVAGFCAYETHCVACHGAAAVPRQQWVGGMEPQPPYLLDASQKFTTSELFWIVRNGIKMTGMPAWRNSMSAAETWDVVAWLEGSARLPPQTYVRWRAQRRCGPSAWRTGPFGSNPRAP